jgi:hypothetical protein
MDPTTLHCSPKAHKFAEKDNTCYSHGELKLLAKEFNKKSPQKITGKNKKELVEKLLKAYEKVCDKHQFCWIKQTLTSPTNVSKLEKSFRPQKPISWNKNRHTWLNTYDILYVLQQYEELYKDFKFLGVYSIDFASKDGFGKCIGDIMCDFDIKKFKKTSFGVVFNTDPSYKGGQHWISLFCNLNPKKKNYGIYFYDSVASPAPKEVKAFMTKIQNQVNDPKFEKLENKIQKQYDNYDCGTFSIVFITQCLKNKYSYDYICKHMHQDEKVNKLRDVLYRPNQIKVFQETNYLI